MTWNHSKREKGGPELTIHGRKRDLGEDKSEEEGESRTEGHHFSSRWVICYAGSQSL